MFPRSYFAPETSFTPLFRLLDDFDNYSRETGSQTGNRQGRQVLPTFSPRFDVKETEAGYELHGELPGIDKKDISIEFTEPQTIVISGRAERSYSSGTPPAGLLGGQSSGGAITDGKNSSDNASASHRASVADEEAERAKEQGGEVTKAGQQPKQEQQPKEKIWVSERSVGEFHRTFSFPTPVDQAAVSANLKDGILSVFVPRAKKEESRKRIAVN